MLLSHQTKTLAWVNGRLKKLLAWVSGRLQKLYSTSCLFVIFAIFRFYQPVGWDLWRPRSTRISSCTSCRITGSQRSWGTRSQATKAPSAGAVTSLGGGWGGREILFQENTFAICCKSRFTPCFHQNQFACSVRCDFEGHSFWMGLNRTALRQK